MNDIKSNIAKNIALYRTSAKMTQAELAEKLNYSDKAVSKWERGESVPDICVLVKTAELLGTDINSLVSDPNTVQVKDRGCMCERNRNRFWISLLAAVSVWFAAVCAFVVAHYLTEDSIMMWQLFIIAIPISAITLLVFNLIWDKNRTGSIILSSIIIWSTIASFYVVFIKYEPWMLFLIGIPLQLACFFIFGIKTKKG